MMWRRVTIRVTLFSGIILILYCLLLPEDTTAGGNMTMGSANIGSFNLGERLISDSSMASFDKLIKNINSNETLEGIATQFDNFLLSDNPKTETLPNSFLTIHYLIVPINNASVLFLEFKNDSSGQTLSGNNLSYTTQVTGNNFKFLDKASTTSGSDIRLINLPVRTNNDLDNLSNYKMTINVSVLNGHTINRYTASLNLRDATGRD